MKIDCIIVDDEPLARKLLVTYCSKIDFISVRKVFAHPLEAIRYLTDRHVDLIFLDIKMPDLSGLSFLDMLEYSPKVIFTTAFSEYAVQGFELEAVDYLLKPFDFARFYKAIDKVRRLMLPLEVAPAVEKEELLIKEGRNWINVPKSSIQYVQGQKDYVMFHTDARRIMSLMNMKDLEGQLMDSGFLRIHHSYIVNTKRISSLSHEKVIIEGKTLPVSISYRQQVKAYIRSGQ